MQQPHLESTKMQSRNKQDIYAKIGERGRQVVPKDHDCAEATAVRTLGNETLWINDFPCGKCHDRFRYASKQRNQTYRVCVFEFGNGYFLDHVLVRSRDPNIPAPIFTKDTLASPAYARIYISYIRGIAYYHSAPVENPVREPGSPPAAPYIGQSTAYAGECPPNPFNFG